jgi:hypothetical protein
MMPAVEAAPVVAEVVKIVSFTSTGVSPISSGTLSTGFVTLDARTIYNE